MLAAIKRCPTELTSRLSNFHQIPSALFPLVNNENFRSIPFRLERHGHLPLGHDACFRAKSANFTHPTVLVHRQRSHTHIITTGVFFFVEAKTIAEYLTTYFNASTASISLFTYLDRIYRNADLVDTMRIFEERINAKSILLL